MSNSRLAIRYATPILDLAIEQNQLEEVRADMANFAALCQSSRELVLMLKSPIIPHLKKAEILSIIFKGKVSELTMSAFQIISRKNREQFLPDIAEEFIRLYNKKKNIQEVTITTPVAIDEKMREEFNKVIKKISGKEPMIKEKVDPQIIGGYVITMDDKQLDESISSHLKELEIKFKKESI